MSQTPQQQATNQLMPGHDLALELAVKAFQLIGSPTFEVSSTLSVDKPESLRNFEMLQNILLMAYQEGARSASVHS